MAYQTGYQLGPETTPRSLQILIWTTIGVSLISALFQPLQLYLVLSLSGIENYYFWQPITYLFVHPGAVSFPFLLHLAFNMYLLWTFGASLMLRSAPLFFALYFGAALFAALAALGAMSLLSFPYLLAGTSAALYALLMAWVILNPEAEMLLFFAIPIKARWLILGLIGANLFIDVSNADWISCTSYLASTIFGYLFAIIAWREQSPFPFLRSFERMVLRNLEKLRHLGKKKAFYRHSKIYDISSGRAVLDDEQFMDAMLARISLYGEDSLSPEEKKRMKAISNRKASEKR